MTVARTHATKASEALDRRDRARPDVCDGVRTLADGLVLRSS